MRRCTELPDWLEESHVVLWWHQVQGERGLMKRRGFIGMMAGALAAAVAGVKAKQLACKGKSFLESKVWHGVRIVEVPIEQHPLFAKWPQPPHGVTHFLRLEKCGSTQTLLPS